MDAMKSRDEASLNRLLGSEFTLGGISELDRPAVTRATWIDNTLHHLKIESVSFDKTKVRILKPGEKAAGEKDEPEEDGK